MSDSSPPAPPRVPTPRAGTTLSSLLTLQVGVAIVAALYVASEVLIPITLAILLSFVLAPLVEFFRHWRLSRVPAVLLAVILALGIIMSFGGVVASQVAQLAPDIPEYATTIEKKVETVRAYTLDRINTLFARLGHQGATFEAQNPSGPHARLGSGPDANKSQAQPATPAEPASSPVILVKRFLFPALSPLATMGIVFVVTIFVLLQREDLRDRLIRLFGTTDLHRTTAALDDAAQRLSTYFLTQLAINATFGVVIGFGLYVIGVPNPVLWGLLSGLLRFVPYIGTYISAALPIALAAGVEPGWSMALWTVALYVGVDLIVSQAVEPMLYGHGTGLSPLAVVVAAIFWGWLWGPIGLIISTPLTLCLVVLGRYVERLEFLDILLGNRPALTPVESFYQRILAGDADEAQDNAEAFLKEHSLSSYYEDVVLKGLQTAAVDVDRGALGEEQLEQVKSTIRELLSELAVYDDREPPSGSPEIASAIGRHDEDPENTELPSSDSSELGFELPTQTPILSIGGKGPLDEAAAAMLAQLLAKHGLGARVVTYESVSRERIASLDVPGTSMICITYLELSGTPSHLRYLVRRLRRKLPDAPILVGLWSSEAEVLSEPRARAIIGADHYSTSLHDAVTCCLRAARQAAAAGGSPWDLAA
jgi:predicted PurR-regulated permease PerM